MKTIGLIGGMSWESSALYYKLLNDAVKAKLGGLHSCQCLMYSIDFGILERLQRAGEWESATEMMIDAGLRLQNGGAEMIVICANTMHISADAMEKKLTIPLIHIVDATAEVIKTTGIKKVGLLGTRFTMEKDFYTQRLRQKHGLEVLIPEEKDIEIIHTVIFKELVCGIISNTSREQYKKIIARLVERGAEGIILGCTEIPLLISQSDCSVPAFDTTKIHAEKAVELALK